MKLNWWKRHILRVSSTDEVFASGGLWALFPVLFIAGVMWTVGRIVGSVVVVNVAATLGLVGFGLGAVSGMVHSIYRSKYVTTPRDCGHRSARHSVVLCVKDGKVIASGRAVLAKGEGVYCVGIPSNRFYFEVTVPYEQIVDGVEVSFEVDLIVGLREPPVAGLNEPFGAFDPQELYDTVIADGFEDVRLWVASMYKWALRDSVKIKDAVASSARDYKGPHAFAVQLREALSSVEFPAQLLSAFVETNAKVTTYPEYSFRVEY